jgi:hypothetical protein
MTLPPATIGHMNVEDNAAAMLTPKDFLLAKRGANHDHKHSNHGNEEKYENHDKFELSGGFEHFPKPGNVIGNAQRRLSCTDKIVRWSCLGLQGGKLSSLIHSAHSSMSLSTVVIGRRCELDRCTRALVRRVVTEKSEANEDSSATSSRSSTKMKTATMANTTIVQGTDSSSLSLEGAMALSAVFGGSTGRSMGGD